MKRTKYAASRPVREVTTAKHTDETRERLRDLWAQDLSSAAIGRRLGMSKNAVVGLAHRMCLPSRPSPIRPGGPKRVEPRTITSKQVALDAVRLPSLSAALPAARAPALPPPAAAIPSPGAAALPTRPTPSPDRAAAGSWVRTCQFPLWNEPTRLDVIRFCDAPVERPGSSYCAACRARTSVKPPPLRMTADMNRRAKRVEGWT